MKKSGVQLSNCGLQLRNSSLQLRYLNLQLRDSGLRLGDSSLQLCNSSLQLRYFDFDGICLTDTFQLGESDNSEKLFSEMFPQNSARVAKQKKAPLRVIMGNPPYSIGQKSANDNASNQEYEKLDRRILDTYSAGTSSKNSKA